MKTLTDTQVTSLTAEAAKRAFAEADHAERLRTDPRKADIAHQAWRFDTASGWWRDLCTALEDDPHALSKDQQTAVKWLLGEMKTKRGRKAATT